MSKPSIVTPDSGNAGYHNRDLAQVENRLFKGKTYKDLSTLCVMPIRDTFVHVRVMQAFNGLIKPMNQKFMPIFMSEMEVGDAYEQMVELVRTHADLKSWKYVLTFESDNLPPPDGLLKLYESIEAGPFDAVGSLYFTKGEGGQPMIYGNPKEMPKNFMPQIPVPDAVQPCNGLGMGFTLFRMKMLQDKSLPRPLFKTVQSYEPGKGTKMYTQDLFFFESAAKHGYRFASDNRVKTGHLDFATNMVW
jgi:hypothetical protein